LGSFEVAMKTFAEDRLRMVEKQIASRGVMDPRVLDAMRTVPREAFVPASVAEFAYEDRPLAIEEGQTISQPYVVALMAEALQLTPRDRVLEVGAGSGYAAAVLSRVAAEVYAVERHAALTELARRRMRELGYDNVHILHGDGTLGCAAHAPYDAIVVAAGGPSIPEALRAQLVIGGRLVIPVGLTPQEQELVRVTRTGENSYEQEGLGDVRFVPLIGAQGWGEGAQAREAVAPGA
jgi:protein-L-isoaspartate(D-aspartate) O-methyltransferase